jgi:FXSXX-COOH protein
VQKAVGGGFLTLYPVFARDEIALPQLELRSVIPNLTEVSLDRLSELGDSVLAHSIAMYRERLKDNGLPLSSFNSKI